MKRKGPITIAAALLLGVAVIPTLPGRADPISRGRR